LQGTAQEAEAGSCRHGLGALADDEELAGVLEVSALSGHMTDSVAHPALQARTSNKLLFALSCHARTRTQLEVVCVWKPEVQNKRYQQSSSATGSAGDGRRGGRRRERQRQWRRLGARRRRAAPRPHAARAGAGPPGGEAGPRRAPRWGRALERQCGRARPTRPEGRRRRGACACACRDCASACSPREAGAPPTCGFTTLSTE